MVKKNKQYIYIYIVCTWWKMLSTKIKTAKECRDQDPDFGGGKTCHF